MTIAIFLKVQEFGLSYMLPTSLAGACWYLLPPVLLVHDFQHSIGRQPPHGVVAPCLLPSVVLPANYLFINFSLWSLKPITIIHSWIVFCFFPPVWKFSLTFICCFVCVFPFSHYLKVCGPTHLRLVAGRGSAIHDLTPDQILVSGRGNSLCLIFCAEDLGPYFV